MEISTSSVQLTLLKCRLYSYFILLHIFLRLLDECLTHKYIFRDLIEFIYHPTDKSKTGKGLVTVYSAVV